MQTPQALKTAAALALCLLPLPALAETDDFDVTESPPPNAAAPAPEHHVVPILPNPRLSALTPPYENEIVIGGGWQTSMNTWGGRYTGLTYPGAYGLGAVHMKGGDAWDSGKTFYYDAQGTDLGLLSRSATINVGEQGKWGLKFFYDGIPNNYSQSFHSLWNRTTLAPGIAPGSISNITTQAGSKMSIQSISTQRDIYGGEGKYFLDNWLIQTGIRHEHKSGYKENSLTLFGAPGALANNGNITTSGLGYFAQPVDYDTNRYDISAQYSEGRLTALIGYTYNTFNNNNDATKLQNPFMIASGTGVTGPKSLIPGVGSSASKGSAYVTAIYSQPPSNSAHQVKAQVGYNLTETTRLNANFQYGLMLQNANYVAGTGNANLTTPSAPSSSLDGSINTYHGNVALTTKPLDNADLRVAYTIDNRSNTTTRRRFPGQYYQDAYSAAPIAPYNLPLSYQHQTFEVQGGYRVLPQTKVMLNYAFDSTYRNYSNTSQVTNNTINAKVRSTLAEGLFTSLSYTHENRVAGNYHRNLPWQMIGVNENEFYGFQNYYLASRVRDEVRTSVDYDVTPTMTLSLMGKSDWDRYPNSQLGLQDNTNFSIGPDLTWRIASNIGMHAYYTYQMIYFNQTSAVSNASCNGSGTTLTTGPAPCQNNGMWWGHNRDTTHSAGVSFDWVPMENLKLSADYTFSYGRNAYSIGNGGIFSFTPAGTASLQLAPIPDVDSMLNAVSLKGEYQFRQNMSLLVGYTFERYSYKDYAVTAASASQFSNAAFSGDSSANYAVHQIYAALRVKF